MKTRLYWFLEHQGFRFFPKPARFEGWVLVGSYLGMLVWDFVRIDTASHSAGDTFIAFAPDFIIITIVFLVFVYVTSGAQEQK